MSQPTNSPARTAIERLEKLAKEVNTIYTQSEEEVNATLNAGNKAVQKIGVCYTPPHWVENIAACSSTTCISLELPPMSLAEITSFKRHPHQILYDHSEKYCAEYGLCVMRHGKTREIGLSVSSYGWRQTSNFFNGENFIKISHRQHIIQRPTDLDWTIRSSIIPILNDFVTAYETYVRETRGIPKPVRNPPPKHP